MWCVGGKEEHAAFRDEDVAEGIGGRGVDHLEEHGAAVLVEPFRGCVDVVVCSGVGSTYDLGAGLLVVGLGAWG